MGTNKLKRIFYFFSPKNKSYRKVLLIRAILAVLKKIQPQLAFIGMRNSKENLFLHYDDRAITVYSLANGFINKREVDETFKLLKQHTALKGNTLLEIGANIGSSTLELVEQGFSKHICYEPDPKNLFLLKANLQVNDKLDTVNIVEAAVSNKSGSIKFALSSLNYGDNRVLEENHVDSSFTESIEVRCLRLEDSLEDLKISNDDVGFIWCDTQGHEGYVLDGSQSLLGKRNAVWLVEYWPEGMKNAGCLEIFHRMVGEYFTKVIDTRDRKVYSPKELFKVDKALKVFAESTDLLLIP